MTFKNLIKGRSFIVFYIFLSLALNGCAKSGGGNNGLFFLLMGGKKGPVADPVLGVVPGTFGIPQSVTLSTPTSGASIRYTIDGSDPTSTAGSIYSSPIYIASTTTVRAIAYKKGRVDSAVVEGVYTIVPDHQVDTPSITPSPGEYNHVQNAAITCAMTGAAIKYTTDGTDPTPTHGTLYTASFQVIASATVKAVAYREGYIDSGIASNDYTLRPHTPTSSPLEGEYSGPQSVTIQSETDGVTIRYTMDSSEPTLTNGETYAGAIELGSDTVTTIRAKAFITGWADSEELSGTFTILPEGTVAAPVITPNTGTYANAQEASISCTTPGATILYTTSGEDPETYGTAYAGSFTVDQTGTTVRAIAVKDGWTNSSEASKTYTLKAANPQFSPASGSFNGAQTVTITSDTEDAQIYYTTNGSNPLTSGALYSVAVTVDRSMTIRAVARKASYEDSEVNDSEYTLSPLAPSISPAAGEYSSPQSVSITCGTADATIKYTTDGSEPSQTNGDTYTTPIDLGYKTTTTVRARALKTGWNDSAVVGSTFTILPEGTAAAPVILPEEGTRYADTEVTLSTTTPSASIKYTTNGDDPRTSGTIYTAPFTLTASATVRAYAYKSGWNDSTVSEKAYTLVVSDPSFSPDGNTYDDVQTVTISTTTPDAAIYYTTTGDDPKESGSLYSSTVTVDRSMTLRAYARKTGWTDSGSSQAVYAMKAATPTFDAPAGSYNEAQTVAISSATPDVTIRYTTDGSDPTTEHGTEYTGSITVDASQTVKAIAYRDNWTASEIGAAAYSFNYGTVATPAFSAGTGTYDAAQDVTITCDTPGATIVYTTDNTEPSRTNGTVYGGGTITVDRTGFILKVFAYLSDWTDSSTATATYTLQPAAPVFSPDGGTYTTSQSVTITSTAGSTIRYTTDGSDPTAETCPTCVDGASPVTVSVSQNTAINAYAYRENWTDSDEASRTYNIKVAIPTLDYGSDMYTGIVLSINCTTSGATIKYTTDGTNPKTSGTAIEGTSGSSTASVSITANMTLRVYAYKIDMTDSDEVTAIYVIRDPKNICLVPPYGSAYPYYPKNRAFTITGPKSFGSHTFSHWRFDKNGDYQFDNIYYGVVGEWQPDNRWSCTYTSPGTYRIIVRARTSDFSYYAFFDNNYIRIVNGITSGTPGFTEINAGSLTGVMGSSTSLGDIDGDGDIDMIQTGQSSSGLSSKIYQNNGSGSFTEINAGTLTSTYLGSTALGDIDGDGDLDLILTGSTGSVNESKIFQNNGSGAFTEINAGSLTGVYNGAIALGDIDGDSDFDLILTGYTGSTPVSKIYQNDGSGSFTEINAGSLTGVYGSSAALGDLDGDGDLDLILSGYTAGSTYVSNFYQNNGSGSFTEPYPGMLIGVCDGSLSPGDIDGDGDLDLILTGYAGGYVFSTIYQNNGSGIFSQIGSLTGVGYHSSSALGDLDGDGDLDLIFSGYTGSAYISKIYQNNGSGSFTEIGSGTLTGVRYASIALGDLDSDGALDLILSGDTGSGYVSKIYQGVSK